MAVLTFAVWWPCQRGGHSCKFGRGDAGMSMISLLLSSLMHVRSYYKCSQWHICVT